MKVGDLVRFSNPDWLEAGGLAPNWGFGLIEEKYDDNTYEVFWPSTMTSRTLGRHALEVLSESR